MVVARCAAGLVAGFAAVSVPAWASGPGETAPWYLDQYGGDAKDLLAFYDGRVGIVKRTAPRPMLFASWRMLHGLEVGQEAGEALATPCCDFRNWALDPSGANNWDEARRTVLKSTEYQFISTDRTAADHVSVPNCFDDAFRTATATLKDRAARYGAGSADVRAWLATQDAVFANCSRHTELPPMRLDAPAWLRADRAYQAAAAALYDWQWEAAAAGFTAIGADPTSPWRPKALYLLARTRYRAALLQPSPVAQARAHAAVALLKRAPEGTFGRADAEAMEEALVVRERPAEARVRLDRLLSAKTAPGRIDVLFKDLEFVSRKAAQKPEMLDWIETLRSEPDDWVPDETPAQATARYAADRRKKLAHAREVWDARHDPSWLVAAMSLAERGDPEAAELVRASETVRQSHPAWLSVSYHRMRLTLASAPAADSRARLDGLLARKDLSSSDRAIFQAQRAQVAADLRDFARHALRSRLCVDGYDWAERGKSMRSGCVRWRWGYMVQPSSVYDGVGDKGTVGLGEDARAVIDRMPLSMRIAMSRQMILPPRIRMDIALTSYARAVQLQDNAAIDATAQDLIALLPLMAPEFRGVVAARPGPDKRFAEFLVLAKIPGVRTDLVDYTRPEGRRVADFQFYWTNWVIPGRADPRSRPPSLVRYQADGYGPSPQDERDWTDAHTDLTCLGECGRSAAPLRLPDFVAAGQPRAGAERSRLWFAERTWNQPEPPPPARSVWVVEELLRYAATHRTDPRAPEALYWLVRMGRWGASHDHSGRRAFRLLHARYPGSVWAKKAPYYYD